MITIPASIGQAFIIELNQVRELDNGGEPCSWCDTEGCTVEIQAYGMDADGNNLFIESGAGCLQKALNWLNAVDDAVLTLEVAVVSAPELPLISEDGRYVVDKSPSDLGGYYVGDTQEGASLGNFPTLPQAVVYFKELTR